ncbi:unnamed protein product, partial [Tetraodon nigroviridis]
MAHCRERGDEMIVGDLSHIHIYEQGGCAFVRALADRYGLWVHMDGARVVNAAVAQRVPLTTILQHTHTVSVSLSK